MKRIQTGEEIEAKFWVSDFSKIEKRLQEVGADLTSPRVFERNLRFDTPRRALSRESKVLRLRQDSMNHLTFKGPTDPYQTVSVREEIEFEVSDFNKAKALLESLGYEVSVGYEKFRSTYLLDGTQVTLDEMPYGYFVEVEGEDAAVIEAVARKLNLNWDARIRESYLAMFSRLVRLKKLMARNLNFSEMPDRPYPLEELGIKPAD